MAEIRRRPHARLDAIDIWRYIARNNVSAADRTIDSFEAALLLLATSPYLGRARPELAPLLRSYTVGNYLLFYRPIADGVDLIRILSGFRDFTPDLLV